MLNKTPRTGFRFLGSGKESVAEHILRTLFIGYSLCKLDPAADELKVLRMCLVHDLPEARTGDQNYMYKKYVTVDEEKAVRELTEHLPFGGEIRAVLEEFNEKKTRKPCWLTMPISSASSCSSRSTGIWATSTARNG
ncbi:MAG: HD domain-containing protein [Desulfosudis oleivorans]|nr:HD domain-containing protein [Desulfosudis oleivorans]